MRKRLTLCILMATWTASAAEPARILVAYYSQTGHTEKLAVAVRDGAASVPGVEVALRKIAEVSDADILKAGGLAVGSPVHWGALSAETKGFLDRVGVTLGLGKQAAKFGEGRVSGVFCTAGGPAGGQDTARLSMIATLLQMRFVVIGGVSAEGYGTLGPQAVTGGKPGGVSPADAAEARAFGERLARLTKQHHSAANSAAPTPSRNRP